MTARYIGKPIPQLDSHLKVTGTAVYTFDMELPGMLYAKLVVSNVAHAKIVKIDTSEASKVPGVVAIATGQDFPFRLGIYVGDRDILAIDKVRWVGHPVAAVIAESMRSAEEAAEKVDVEYELLPTVFTVEEALKPNATLLHEKLGEYRISPAFKPLPGTNIANSFELKHGDVGVGFKEADLVLEEDFKMPYVSHGFMETQVVIADYHKDGTIEVWTSAQSAFATRYLMALSLGIPVNNIIIRIPFVGGGFGGKAGLGWEALVAMLSKKAGNRPVKLVLSRRDQFVSAAVREAFYAHVKAGFKKDGTITAYDAKFVMDAGGYADYTVNVSRTAGYSGEGSYEIHNVHILSLAVYTNKVCTTAMRGFGYPESHWALEQIIDHAAKKLGLDPFRMRLLNIAKPGESTTATGEKIRLDAGDPEKVLRTVVDGLKYFDKEEQPKEPWKVRAKGFALSLKGPSQPPNAAASALLKFNEDTSIDIMVGTGSFGQGTTTSLCMIAAEEFGLPLEKVRISNLRSTDNVPYTWQTVGSRGLFTDANSLLNAIKDAKRQITDVALQVFRVPADDVMFGDGKVFVRGRPWISAPLSDFVLGYTYPNGNAIGGPIVGKGTFMSILNSYLDPDTGQGVPTIFHTFGGTGVEIELDLLTGEIRILKGVQVYDVGRVINKLMLDEQMDGGFIMGQGAALYEGLKFDEQGWVMNPNFTNYYVPRCKDIADTIDKHCVETPQSDGPLGARGIGEMVMIATAPAIANAIFGSIGVRMETLPMNPENVWQAIKAQRPELIKDATEKFLSYKAKGVSS
ncbi:MAG: xanthine dehydrogenase family protein molybdopterin-binding subunit [Conexivisphaerales archaeon]